MTQVGRWKIFDPEQFTFHYNPDLKADLDPLTLCLLFSLAAYHLYILWNTLLIMAHFSKTVKTFSFTTSRLTGCQLAFLSSTKPCDSFQNPSPSQWTQIHFTSESLPAKTWPFGAVREPPTDFQWTRGSLNSTWLITVMIPFAGAVLIQGLEISHQENYDCLYSVHFIGDATTWLFL